jgi:hypothetical protein
MRCDSHWCGYTAPKYSPRSWNVGGGILAKLNAYIYSQREGYEVSNKRAARFIVPSIYELHHLEEAVHHPLCP